MLPELRSGKIRTLAAPFKAAEGVVRVEDLGGDRRVRLHLSVHHQLRRPLLDHLHGPFHREGMGVLHRAEIGEGEHGYARLDIQHPRRFGGQYRRFGQFFGGRINGDRGVGEKKDPPS